MFFNCSKYERKRLNIEPDRYFLWINVTFTVFCIAMLQELQKPCKRLKYLLQRFAAGLVPFLYVQYFIE